MQRSRIGFGLFAPQETFDYETVREYCLEAERLGYDAVWLIDHLMPALLDHAQPSSNLRAGLMLEAWTLMTAIAVQTKRIRTGLLVMCNCFRQPSLVAKMAASLDVISGGRLEFGIGAGWLEPEATSYGYEFPAINVRIKKLGETLAICKLMWTEDSPTFDGKYYRIAEPPCYPKPLQVPHPPIWVGGNGDYTLKMIARYADKWNGNRLSAQEVAEKIKVLTRHCAEIGRDVNTIEKTWNGTFLIDEDEAKIRASLERKANRIGQPVEELEQRMIAGTPDQCVARIEEYIATGITYFVVGFSSLRDRRSPVLFAERVMSRFR